MSDAFLIDDDVTYLNTAYMAPRLKCVHEAGLKGLERCAARENTLGVSPHLHIDDAALDRFLDALCM